MNSKDLETITNSIQEKLGKENSALISDDLGKLITLNSNTLTSIQDKDKEIERLTQNNEKLVIANGNLLQQIPMGKEEDKHQSSDSEVKSFNFREAFDKNGRFKV